MRKSGRERGRRRGGLVIMSERGINGDGVELHGIGEIMGTRGREERMQERRNEKKRR